MIWLRRLRTFILIVLAITAFMALCDNFARRSHADTLVMMPPARYANGCGADVTIIMHHGNVMCGLASSAACSTFRGKQCTIHLPSDVSPAVRSAMKVHEMAHCCGWPASHPGWHWSKPLR